MKTIITFGSAQLAEIAHKVNPMKVMLVIEAPNEYSARNKVFESFIGKYFAFSYAYSKAEEFKKKYNMEEYSLEELIEMKKGENNG